MPCSEFDQTMLWSIKELLDYQIEDPHGKVGVLEDLAVDLTAWKVSGLKINSGAVFFGEITWIDPNLVLKVDQSSRRIFVRSWPLDSIRGDFNEITQLVSQKVTFRSQVLGTISNVIVDAHAWSVKYLCLSIGPFFKKEHVYLPAVLVNAKLSPRAPISTPVNPTTILSAPKYKPLDEFTQGLENRIMQHYFSKPTLEAASA